MKLGPLTILLSHNWGVAKQTWTFFFLKPLLWQLSHSHPRWYGTGFRGLWWLWWEERKVTGCWFLKHRRESWIVLMAQLSWPGLFAWVAKPIWLASSRDLRLGPTSKLLGLDFLNAYPSDQHSVHVSSGCGKVAGAQRDGTNCHCDVAEGVRCETSQGAGCQERKCMSMSAASGFSILQKGPNDIEKSAKRVQETTYHISFNRI